MAAVDRRGRRSFLLATAGLVAAAARRPAAQASLPIVIVGAGLAGLRAAERLLAAGERVVVIEGRRRPGGRVLTVRAPFSGDLYGDAGPIRIPQQHRRLLDLIARYDLPLVPFASGSGEPLAVARGVRATPPELDRLSEALGVPAMDRGRSQGELLQKYVGDLPDALSDPDLTFDRSWSQYDAETWPAWLRRRGASDASIAMMTLGGDSRELSALYVLRQYALLREGSLYKIAGGMDRIAAAMAGAVDTHVRYDARVTRLEPARSNVMVEYVERGRRHTVTARRVIVTVPAPVLSRIATSSPALHARAALVAAVPYFPATRFLVETARRSWHDDGLSGTARTDRPAEVWETAYEAEGVMGLLGATVGGELGRALARGTREAALRLGPDVVQQAFPSVTPRRSSVYRWAADRWAGGAFATFRPGQMTQLLPVIGVAVGRVHFAGEHTAGWMGWMEGALQSADRAVEEVLA